MPIININPCSGSLASECGSRDLKVLSLPVI